MDFPLQLYDVIMLAVLALSAILGLWKGMAWQLASLASLVISYLAARQFSGPLAPYFGAEGPWNHCIAMLVIYLVTSLVIWILFQQVVAGVIDRVKLKEFDRQIGAMFGAAKGVLWCLLITFFAVTLSEPARQKVLHSRSGFYAAMLIHRARPALPPKIRGVLGRYLDDFQKKLDPKTAPQHPPDADVGASEFRGLGSYGRQTVGNSPRKPRSGERGYGLGECLSAKC